MQKIVPFLWFDGRLEEAIDFYRSVFGDVPVLSSSRYGEAGPGPAGGLMVATFELCGQRFMGLNGGPQYSFTPAVSFVVNCETQDEVDYYWERLADGGATNVCGWLTDPFGLSWQIVPTALGDLMAGGDAASRDRVMAALMGMTKLEIAGLEAAARG